MAYLPSLSVAAEIKIDRAAVKREFDATRSEIARTLAAEALEVATEEIQVMGAIDTGAMRASGHLLLPDGVADEAATAAGSVRSEALAPDWTPEEPGDAAVVYGAEYAEMVHEGYGSNAVYGPRPFLTEAEKDVQSRARKIAEDIVRRRYGS